MSLLIMDRAAMGRFDSICSAVASRGGGLSLTQLGDATTLARELGLNPPDPQKVRALRERLGLELEQDGADHG